MRVISREYKVMLRPGAFVDRRAGLKAFAAELRRIAGAVPGVSVTGEWDRKVTRAISFLDTDELLLKGEGLVLRRRAGRSAVQYTLKCRSEDRYDASGVDLAATKGLSARDKLEEDIGPPFVSRFSHSNTVTLTREEDKVPATIKAAASIFPVLGSLGPERSRLWVVNDREVFERVLTGPRLIIDRGKDKDEKGELALILWSDGKGGDSLVAEFSFRFRDRRERYGRGQARAARAFFEMLQASDACLPAGTSKTGFLFDTM